MIYGLISGPRPSGQQLFPMSCSHAALALLSIKYGNVLTFRNSIESTPFDAGLKERNVSIGLGPGLLGKHDRVRRMKSLTCKYWKKCVLGKWKSFSKEEKLLPLNKSESGAFFMPVEKGGVTLRWRKKGDWRQQGWEWKNQSPQSGKYYRVFYLFGYRMVEWGTRQCREWHISDWVKLHSCPFQAVRSKIISISKSERADVCGPIVATYIRESHASVFLCTLEHSFVYAGFLILPYVWGNSRVQWSKKGFGNK